MSKPLGNLQHLGDYDNALRRRRIPATGQTASGPLDGPIHTEEKSPIEDVVRDILTELLKENFAATPHIRSADLGGAEPLFTTLDWSAVGQMGRFVLRNKGASSVWISFDVNGESVDAFTSDRSVEVQPNESWNLDRTRFFKIGVKTTGAATVHAIAYEEASGRGKGAVL